MYKLSAPISKAFTILLIGLVLLISANASIASDADSIPTIRELKAAVTVTNNGISVIPTFGTISEELPSVSRPKIS